MHLPVRRVISDYSFDPNCILNQSEMKCTPCIWFTVFMSIYARINVPAKLLWEKDRIGDRGDKSCIAGGSGLHNKPTGPCIH